MSSTEGAAFSCSSVNWRPVAGLAPPNARGDPEIASPISGRYGPSLARNALTGAIAGLAIAALPVRIS
ncbi:MAG: hypothetical protein U5K74_12360 [Gemmatimonadaceae bacterium]|nr:hypothetical protein [Gemmatimonadaceae bacterium]